MTHWIDRELQDAVRRAHSSPSVDEMEPRDQFKIWGMLENSWCVDWSKKPEYQGGGHVRVPTILAIRRPFVMVAAEDIRAGDILCYGPWATWDSKIKKFIVPVYRGDGELNDQSHPGP